MAKRSSFAARAVYVRSLRPLSLTLALLVILGLAACGSDDSDRSFAPETGGDSSLPTNTPLPTRTTAPIDRQPGEGGEEVEADALFKEKGPAAAITSGLADVSIVQIESGEADQLPVARRSATLALASPDGTRCLVIDRSGEVVAVRMFGADGSVIAEWSPGASATPVATPASQSAPIRIGDRIAWSPDGARVAIAISGVGVYAADPDLNMGEVKAGPITEVTSLAWSPSGQSIAFAVWNTDTQSAAIVTVRAEAPDASGTSVFALPEGDGRYVRSLAWGSERVGLVFALRTVSSNFSLPNDLYFLPRFGEPMRLLASAGVAAPAAVVDQVTVAGNGTTVAFTILVPGEVGLRFHSVWATDALAPAPTQADTSGIRRVTDILWTSEGLVISGTRRTQQEGAAYQVAVVEQLTAAEPRLVASDRSEATPLASPQASPVAATPEADAAS